MENNSDQPTPPAPPPPPDQKISEQSNHHPLLGNEELFQTCNSFDEIGVSEGIQYGYYLYGFSRPREPRHVQKKVFWPFFSGKDCTVVTPRRSGITTAYGTLALQRVDHKLPDLQAIIVVSTNELAIRVVSYLNDLQAGSSLIHITTIPESMILEKTAHILVGTPAATREFISRNNEEIAKNLKLFVMRNISISDYYNDLVSIIHVLPETTQQILIFSEVPQKEIEISLFEQFQTPRVFLQYDWKEMLALDGIAHTFMTLPEEFKLETMQDIFQETFSRFPQGFHAVVYCSSLETVDYLARNLQKDGDDDEEKKQKKNSFMDGVVVCCVDERITPEERAARLLRFRQESKGILLSSVSFELTEINRFDLPLLIHYDPPRDHQEYLLRVGRFYGPTDWWSRVSIAFFLPEQADRLTSLQETIRFRELFAEDLEFSGNVVNP